jgi:hypothetical protein
MERHPLLQNIEAIRSQESDSAEKPGLAGLALEGNRLSWSRREEGDIHGHPALFKDTLGSYLNSGVNLCDGIFIPSR